MSDTLNQAVAYLKDLLDLGRTTTSAVDQATLDALVDELAPIALEDVGRFAVARAADAAAVAEAVVEAEAQAARNAVEAEERDAQALVQDETDAAQRQERMRSGVS